MTEPIRYFSDQNFTKAVMTGLRAKGIDVLTAHEAGRCGYTDPEQLEFSTLDGRVLVTFDRDFLLLHAQDPTHAGIAWVQSERYTIGQLIAALELLHAVYAADDMLGRLEYL